MRRAAITLTVGFYLILTSWITVHAQTRFIEEGQNAFGVSGSLISGEDVTATALSLSAGLNGAIDLSISVGRISIDNSDIGATAVAISGTIHALKPSSVSSLGVAISGFRQRDSYSGGELDRRGVEMNGTSSGGGVEIYSSLEASPTVDILPFMGVVYVTTTVTAGNSKEADDDEVSASFGGSVALHTSGKAILTITPSIMIGQATAFSIAVGILSTI